MTTTKWTVSVKFTRPKAYHQFFSLLNRSLIKDTKLINHSHAHMIIEFETTTAPDEAKIKKMGSVINVKIVEIKDEIN
jgi:SRSO17 transposase